MSANTKLIKLTANTSIKPFDCGDSDLNDFLFKDSFHYIDQLLATTYLYENSDDTIAFYSLLNDKITNSDAESNRKFSKMFKDVMPISKRYNSYPAMKIGRFGVSEKYKGSGIGSELIDYLKGLFINNNRTGCRYITVDAYKASLSFYEKNDFIYLTSEDKNSDTRLMYYDLKKLK